MAFYADSFKEDLLKEVLLHLDSIQDYMTGCDARLFENTIRSIRNQNVNGNLTPAYIGKALACSVLPKYVFSYRLPSAKDWVVWSPFSKASSISIADLRKIAQIDVLSIYKQSSLGVSSSELEKRAIDWCRAKTISLIKFDEIA